MVAVVVVAVVVGGGVVVVHDIVGVPVVQSDALDK